MNPCCRIRGVMEGQCLPVLASPVWSNFLLLMRCNRPKFFPPFLKLGREWILRKPTRMYFSVDYLLIRFPK